MGVYVCVIKVNLIVELMYDFIYFMDCFFIYVVGRRISYYDIGEVIVCLFCFCV